MPNYYHKEKQNYVDGRNFNSLITGLSTLADLWFAILKFVLKDRKNKMCWIVDMIFWLRNIILGIDMYKFFKRFKYILFGRKICVVCNDLFIVYKANSKVNTKMGNLQWSGAKLPNCLAHEYDLKDTRIFSYQITPFDWTNFCMSTS